jgi:tol-pal system protein YbgF
MKRLLVLIALLLAGFVVGCASQGDFRTLQADITALERQRVQHDKAYEQRIQTLGEQLARLEQSQAETRRELAQEVATVEELRVDLQGLHGAMQETRHHMQRGAQPTAEMRDVFATKLAELATRLGELESRLAPTSRTSPPSSALSPTPPTVAKEPPSTPAPRPPVPTQPVTPSGSTPPPEVPADRLYKRALQEYQQGNYEVAVVLFKQLLRQHPQATLAGHSQYWIGESLYAQKQFEAAIVAFDEVIRKYPQDAKAPAALLRQGYAFAELEDLRNARFFLQQVQKKYPKSPEAQQAAEKLKQLGRKG